MTRKIGTLMALAVVLFSTTVWAFGGGSSSRNSQYYKRHAGVDGVGIHYHGDGHQGDFCLFDLSNDPNAEEVQEGVFQCKGGYILNCDTGVCDPCAAGSYAPAGSDSCQETPAGSYTPEGASNPIPCPVGTYSASAGATSCAPTDPGYYTSAEGATEQIECEVGYYCPGGTDHQKATPGHYVPTTGAASQTATDPGYYTSEEGATGQVQCEAGYYCPGGTDRVQAEPGYYVPTAGATTQTPADPGYYVPTAGATTQTPADPGYYVPSAEASEQTMCPANTYQDEAAQTSCKDVDPGYQPSPEPPAAPDEEIPCTDQMTPGACGCPSGQYADGEGGCECRDNSGCAADEFCDIDSKKTVACDMCPPGGVEVFSGACKKLADYTYTLQSGYRVSDADLVYPSAENWCRAQGGQLESMTEVCTAVSGTTWTGNGSPSSGSIGRVCLCKDGGEYCNPSASIETANLNNKYKALCTHIEGDPLPCTQNSDCADDEYCKRTGIGSTETGGTCESLGTYKDATISGLGDVRKSDTTMSYWAAANWCEKQNGSLIETKDVGCYQGTTLQTNPTYAYCCAEGKTCSSWKNYWSDVTTIKPENVETVNATYSPILIQLRRLLGKGDGNEKDCPGGGCDWSWTKTPFDNGNPPERMMYVYFTPGQINRNFLPYNDGGYALCLMKRDPTVLADCTGKADGTSCSDSDADAICIDQTCNCRYTDQAFDMASFSCVSIADAPRCERLTERPAVCTVDQTTFGEHSICVPKDSTYTGSTGYNQCDNGRLNCTETITVEGHECCATYECLWGCYSNDDCGDGEYCKITGTGSTQTGGSCQPLGTHKDATISGLGTLRKSDATMSQWAAANWCEKEGGELVETSDIGCYQSGTTTLFTDQADYTYCCASGKSCGSWTNKWEDNGVTIKDDYVDDVTTNYSPTLIALRQALGTEGFDWSWTQTKRKNNPAKILYVHFKFGQLNRQMSPYDEGGHALCKMPSTPVDVTDCTGKADGTVCSAVDSSSLGDPEHELPVCINGNCECPYTSWSLDQNEGVCIQEPDGWGAAACNKLTEKEVACSVGGDGQFIQYACVDKNSSFNGAVVDDSQLGCSWTCGEDRDAETGCCMEISQICISPPFPDDEYYTYTDAANVVHNVSKCYAQSEDITEWMTGVEPYVLIPTNEKGEWTTKCVTAHAVDKYSGYGSGTLMLLADQHAVGFCPDELVQTHGGCIDPAAVNVVVQF